MEEEEEEGMVTGRGQGGDGGFKIPLTYWAVSRVNNGHK